MPLMLSLRQWFSQRLCIIVIRRYFAHFNVFPAHDFSPQMKLSEHMFGLWCDLGSFSCIIAPSLSQYNLIGPATLETTPSSETKFLIPTAYFAAAAAAAINSASVVESTYSALFGTFPTNCTSIQSKDVTRLR